MFGTRSSRRRRRRWKSSKSSTKRSTPFSWIRPCRSLGSDHKDAVCELGCRADADDAHRVREIHHERNREVGQGRQDRAHQGGLNKSSRLPTSGRGWMQLLVWAMSQEERRRPMRQKRPELPRALPDPRVSDVASLSELPAAAGVAVAHRRFAARSHRGWRLIA